MYAHGIINMFGGLFGTWPAGGVITHAPLADQAGAKTLMFVWVCAVITIFSMILISELPYLLYWLPKGVLAGIVYSACIGMFPYQKIKELFVHRAGHFGVHHGVGIFQGIEVGVGLSIIFLVQRSSKPHCAIIGRIPQSRVYGSITTWSDAVTTPGVVVFRFDGALYFGNTNYFKRSIQVLVQRNRRLNKPFHYFVLDCHAMNDLDSSGVLALDNIVKYLRQNRIIFLLTDIKYPVMKLIKRSHLSSLLNYEHIFYNVFQAHMYIYFRSRVAKGEPLDDTTIDCPTDYTDQNGVNLINLEKATFSDLEKSLTEKQQKVAQNWMENEVSADMHPLKKERKGFQLEKNIRISLAAKAL
ncbi:sulfate transporter [Reticulomyxa filosa]|uniref:Sulfate transporter n=1 Tax=Reticulomyxa filosa TaxID=46433 RepID=X6NZ93_RETFI|nr:sulfate transporter [Reticulomyxa filosa]|eukprot:ETO31286.1 sulfate transporter [Reticulomyxa filosa]